MQQPHHSLKSACTVGEHPDAVATNTYLHPVRKGPFLPGDPILLHLSFAPKSVVG